MAGSTPRNSLRPGRVGVRLLTVAIFAAVVAPAVGAVAHAQVPGLPGVPGVPGVPGLPAPDVPDIPEPVADAIEQAEDTLIPVLIDGALAAQPAATAAGFAIRPACSGVGTAVLLLALSGGSLPVSPGFVATPVLIFCGASYDPGPADPVFEQVDAAAGPHLEEAVQPVLDQIGDALAPVRPDLAEACSVISLAGSTPRQVPPPLNRLNITKEVCGG